MQAAKGGGGSKKPRQGMQAAKGGGSKKPRPQSPPKNLSFYGKLRYWYDALPCPTLPYLAPPSTGPSNHFDDTSNTVFVTLASRGKFLSET